MPSVAYRCPRCGATDIVGRSMSVGHDEPHAPARRIEELFCPGCGLLEAIDSAASDRGDAVRARWRRG